MNTHLMKVPLALLATAFLLGCHEGGAGSVGPESVGPQLAEGGGPVSVKWTCDDRPDHPSCAPPSPETTFNVTIVSGQISSEDDQVATALDLVFEDFTLNLGFFNTYTSCTSLGEQVGTLSMTRGDADGAHVHVNFSFEHSQDGVKSKHTLSIEGVPEDVNIDWGDPTKTRVAISGESGYWTMTAKGRNHQNGCKGEEDGDLDSGDEVKYTITVAPPAS